MSFPYTLTRRDVRIRELETGYLIKLSNAGFFLIEKKRPWRSPVAVTCAALNQLVIELVEHDSNLLVTSGTMTLKGYTGNKDQNFLTQMKYLALGTVTPVTLQWEKEALPTKATVNWTSTLIPIASPLVIDRYSFGSAMRLQATIDNRAGVAAVAQTFYLEMVEYEFEKTDAPQRGEIYVLINSDGFASVPIKA